MPAAGETPRACPMSPMSPMSPSLDLITEKVVKKYFGDIVKGPVIRYKLSNLYALNFILKSLKINPNDYIALNTLGIVYLELKKYSDAENI